MTTTSEPTVSITARENAEHGFVAPEPLAKNLQTVLVDLVALQLFGKQAHWNIVGPNFRDLHLNLDEVVDVARAGADTIAERMRALHATTDGRVSTVAEQTSIRELPAGEILTSDAIDWCVRAIEATTSTMREVHDEVDAADPSTADLLHGLITDLEQQAWLLSAETRIPRT